MASCIVRALSLLALLGLLASFTPAHAGSTHPYFDDGGTLVWYHRLADAQQAARAEGKVIFVEFGRRRCGSCKVLCSRILPDPRVRGRLSAVAVGLAAECDHPEPAIGALFNRHLRNAHMLPFAAFLTPDGQWITGFAGSGRVESFLGHLARAERACPRPLGACRPAHRPKPQPVVVKREVRRPVAPLPTPRPQPSCVTPRAAMPQQRPQQRPQQIAPRPPSVELAEADRAGRTSVSRVRVVTVPPARLTGSPDARVIEFPPMRMDLAKEPCRSPRCQGSRTQEHIEGRIEGRANDLPPPAIASVRSGPKGTPAVRTPVSRQATAVELVPTKTAESLWADERLDFAANAVAAGRVEEGLTAIEEVLDRMPGETAFVDAARGLDAIQRLLQQRFLDPEGQVAKAARRMAYEDMWGTRWAKLFK